MTHRFLSAREEGWDFARKILFGKTGFFKIGLLPVVALAINAGPRPTRYADKRQEAALQPGAIASGY